MKDLIRVIDSCIGNGIPEKGNRMIICACLIQTIGAMEPVELVPYLEDVLFEMSTKSIKLELKIPWKGSG